MLCLLLHVPAMAQEINSGVQTQKPSVNEDMKEEMITTPATEETSTRFSPIADIHVDAPSDEPLRINPKAIEVPRLVYSPYLLHWNGGGITGHASHFANLTAYGSTGGVTLSQQWGRLSLATDVTMSKAAVNAVGIVNGIGADAQLSYRVNRNVTVTGFGGIGNYGMMGPAPAMTTGHFGGYVSLTTNNDRWGIDLGVREAYNPMTGRWETIPIAMPYYKLWGSKLGFDFGSILYQALFDIKESISERKMNMSGNAPHGSGIIAPPIDTAPKFSPIEMPKSAKNTCID